MEELNYVYPPPNFIPYLEKYRIYELFQNMATELIIAKPVDHVVFLKAYLMKMLKDGRDLHKIFLIYPPKCSIDIVSLVERMAMELNIVPLTRKQVLEPFTQYVDNEKYVLDPKALADVVLEKLKNPPYIKKGWIMHDYPSTPEEAYNAQRAGILPTCALYLVGPCDSDPNCRTQELSRIYKATLQKIKLCDTIKKDLVRTCCSLAKKKRPSGMASLYRVVLLGPSGCRRHAQAQALANTFNLVQVNFMYLFRQASLRDDEIGKKIHSCKTTYTDIVELLRGRLYQKDCLQRGWVLTHFPRNVKEFEILDNMDTPPNRVVFLMVPRDECKKKIIEHDLKGMFQFSEFGVKGKLKEVEDYFGVEYDLRQYCGETAVMVDATGTAESIQTGIQEAVMRIPCVDLVRGTGTPSEPDTASYDYQLSADPVYSTMCLPEDD